MDLVADEVFDCLLDSGCICVEFMEGFYFRPARLLVSHFHKCPDEYPLPYIKFRQAIYH